jgi:DNA-binding transcriptional regulator/RsmH inhibitor MraZ
MDKQGRILIPQHLRESASIDGDVAVMGQLHFLEVWNREKVTNRMEADPYTRDDAVVLAELGI